jgi:hypothetical protein
MPARYEPIEVRPSQGGALISNLSADTAGILHYVTKLNFRRYIDRELRREGHDYFQGNTDAALGNQPFPYGIATNINPGGNWGGTADKVAVKKGWSYLYIDGENEDHAVNGPGDGEGDEITSGTLIQAAADEIWIYPEGDAIGDPRTYQLLEWAPITLIHETRRPNGQRALIIGTPTTLYKFFALENGDVYEDEVYDDPPNPNAPCFAEDTGEWIIIADGFDPEAQRWQAVCINGDSVFNNGRDPEFTFRAENLTAKPVYELREAGIAAVGAIAEFFGIQMLGDISEIHSEKLLELFDPIGVRRSGAMLGTMVGDTFTTTQDFFSASDVGRFIILENGFSAPIIAFNNARDVNLSGGNNNPPQRFMLRTPASQTGSLFSGTISGTQANGSPNVAASAPIFSAPMVGKRLRYVNGWSSVIITFTDNQHVVLDDNAPETFTALSFFVASEPEQASADYKVTAAATIFTSEMVGREISWEDGTVRRIVAFIDATNVYVDSDLAIASSIIGIENPDTYAAYTEKQFINRVSYRLTWSMNELPTRFAPTYKGSMAVNGFTLFLDQPAKSFKIGDQVTVAGAGTAGGNLTANVVYVAANRVLSLDQRAVTAVTSADLIKADAATSIVGFEDLQDDTSGIVGMLELDGSLVIYKDTAIVLARYTGQVAAPFSFLLRRIDASRALFYRNTLVMVNNTQHVFAGRNSFYRFKIVDLYPTEMSEMEVCKDKFFDRAKLENSKWIFGANNILTKEVFFSNFPYTGDDRVICLDYLSQPMTASTSDITISAAAAVKRPAAGPVVGEIEDWFLMGTPKGVVLLYGLVYLQSQTFEQAKQIFFRRDANPVSLTKGPYTSRLKSGLSDFGSISAEKDIRSWVPILSSKSAQTSMTLTLYGTRNPVEAPTALMSAVISPVENLAPMFFRSHYFADQIEIAGIDNPFELTARVLEISGVRSASFTRRVTS